MVTPAQNAANLRSAERLIAIEQGIDNQAGTWRTSLTYDQRVAYENALALYIVTHPARFSAGTVETARWISQHGHTPLEDTDFDFAQFQTAAVDNIVAAGEKIGGIGDGVLATANAASWAIPLAAAIVVVIGLVSLNKRLSA